MGGMIGQTFALKYPGIFTTLVLADTTSRMPAEALPTWQDRIRIAQEKGMKPLVEPTLGRWFTEPYRKAAPQTMQRIGLLIGTTPVAGYVGCCHAIPKINLTSRLKEIRTPILIIVGEDDPGTPVAMSKEIHENAPGSKLVVLPKAAHLSNIEQSAAFNRALDEFLKAH
jgi:3-oxoadipate enol-lactonase